MPKNKANYTETRREDWGTPKDLFAKLNAVFEFEVDLAATAENTLCPLYCSAEDGDSGFFDIDKEFFRGRPNWCWCNPPYGTDLAKWVQEVANKVERAVMLIPASPGNRWWHKYIWPRAHAIVFINGRLTFDGAPSPAQFDSALVVVGRVRSFNLDELAALNQFGVLVQTWRVQKC